MRKVITDILRFTLFMSLGLVILWLVYRGQNKAYQEECALRDIPAESCSLLDKVLQDFAEANYYWIFLVLLLFVISNISRAIRWQMLIRPLGYEPRFTNSFWSIILGYFANLGLPRVGEVVRAGTLARYERIPVEKVLGTIFVDRVVDVLSILLVTALALVLQYQVIWAFAEENISILGRLGGLGRLLLVLTPIGLAGLGAIWFFRERLKRTAFFQNIFGVILGFAEGLKTIGRLRRPWLFLFHSVNIWLMYFLMTYICFFAFAPTAHLGPVVGLVVFVFGGWGIVVPSPGGMGTYHFMVQTALAMYGISGDNGFSFANIAFFSIQLGVNVFLGLIALAVLPALNRHYQPVKLEPAHE